MLAAVLRCWNRRSLHRPRLLARSPVRYITQTHLQASPQHTTTAAALVAGLVRLAARPVAVAVLARAQALVRTAARVTAVAVVQLPVLVVVVVPAGLVALAAVPVAVLVVVVRTAALSAAVKGVSHGCIIE